MTSAALVAVAKSGLISSSVNDFSLSSSTGSRRSTSAPLAIRPEVGTPCVSFSACPADWKPETLTGPCAAAYMTPSAPDRGVIIRIPPESDVAFPSDDTVTSIREPSLVKAGSSAVTITAAAFFV